MLDRNNFSCGSVNCFVDSPKTATTELFQHRVLVGHSPFCRHIAKVAMQEQLDLDMRQAIVTRRSSGFGEGAATAL